VAHDAASSDRRNARQVAQALLNKHGPQLCFDRQYDYRAAAVATAVDNPGNLIRRRDGEVVARAGGEPPLTLETLSGGQYANELEPSSHDCLSQAPDVIGDARRMERDPHYRSRLYGRVVRDSERTWLQYWIWLYYNPKNLLGFGKHEGDWEMIQIGLDPSGAPEVVTYCQHDSGEARSWEAIETEGDRPVVYVAPLSHASYFEAKTHPYPIGIDHPYGDGPKDTPEVEPIGPWATWPGRWGNSERVIAKKIGNGPPSPGHQGLKWDDPSAFHGRMRRRKFRQWIGAVLHWIGKPFYPLAPSLETELTGGRIQVKFQLAQTSLRRSRHLYFAVHEGNLVVANRVVEEAPASGEETILLPTGTEATVVSATSFNRLRQRSDLIEISLGGSGA
jgi:hypothetical protein